MIIRALLPLFTVTLMMPLAGCGFTPMHAPSLMSSQPNAIRNFNIQVVPQDNLSYSEGVYTLEQSLYNRLGKNSTGPVLEITPRFGRTRYGVTSTDVASRFDLGVTVKYRILDEKTRALIHAGEASSVTTFGAPRSVYGISASEKNAMKTVAVDVADRIIVRLAAYYADPDKSEAFVSEPDMSYETSLSEREANQTVTPSPMTFGTPENGEAGLGTIDPEIDYSDVPPTP